MKRKHNLAFHLVMLLLITVSTILVFYRALVHLREQIDEIKINSVYRVRQIGEDYDMLLRSNEEMINEKLLEIKTSLLKDTEQISDLDETAIKFGLDLIIITDLEGNVKTSTDMTLKGANIRDIIPGYYDMIALGLAADDVIIDRAGLLTDSDTIYKSAWLIDSASNKLIIYAVDMLKYLEDNNSQSFAEFLFGGYFENLAESILMVKTIDLVFRQGDEYYSVADIERGYEEQEKLQIYSSIESQILNGYEYVIIPELLKGSTGLNQVMIKVYFDNDMIRQISSNLLFRALLGFIVLAVVIYLIVYFFFKSSQHDREELILKIIEAIRQKKFRRDIFEKDTFNKEIESGLIELAENYQNKHEDKSKELAELQEANELLRQQLENENLQTQSLAGELNDARNQYEQMQRTDRLTGLPNRETLIEYLDYESARSDREKQEFGLMFLKLNNMSGLRNAFGNNFTDYLINKVGSKLRSILRRQDHLGRWAEEVFLLILPTTGSIGIRQLIAKLDEMLSQTEFFRDDKRIKLEILFGGTIYQPGSKVGDCLRQCNVAVQEAEHSGSPAVIE
ncbi:MAG: diguanylate cyclase [Candidatus Cloacimonetes bacterium]|nr:diguanylate cyclase [Candidatus Cloacimonadota bacterium]